MNPTKNVRASRLVMSGDLQQVPIDPDACREMVAQARRHADTVRYARGAGDLEGAFQLAYDACRKIAHGYVLAWGVRPSGDAHHASTFDAAAALLRNDPRTRGLVAIVDDATDLRYARAGAQYAAEKLTATDVDDALETLAALLDAVPDLMEDRLATTERSA